MVGTVIAKIAGSTLGDTYTFPAADGASGEFLKTDGSTNLSFGSAAAGGKVLQVLGTSLNTTVTSTSTSYVASGLTITLTPASASSKFLLILSGGQQQASVVAYECLTTFYVDGSEVAETGPYELWQQRYNRGPHSATCLHAPSTVSAVTYAPFYKVNSSPAGQYATFNLATARVTFTVMELSS